MTYSRTVHVDGDFAQTVTAVREALAEQGFGILTEIDVRATLKEKLGHEMEDYLILGACSPPLAHPPGDRGGPFHQRAAALQGATAAMARSSPMPGVTCYGMPGRVRSSALLYRRSEEGVRGEPFWAVTMTAGRRARAKAAPVRARRG